MVERPIQFSAFDESFANVQGSRSTMNLLTRPIEAPRLLKGDTHLETIKGALDGIDRILRRGHQVRVR